MNQSFKLSKYALLLLLNLVLVSSVTATVDFMINPSTLSNNFTGQIVLNVTGATIADQPLRVEKWIDLNRNGSVDSDDYVVESFDLTDGQQTRIGGARNFNVPGDNDGAINGEIQCVLFYPGVAGWANKIAGHFVYRISDSQNSFAPVTHPFSVVQKVQPQGVRGQLTFSTGLPMTNTLVLLNQSYDGQVTGSITDSTGHYLLYTKPGDYYLTVVNDGLLRSASNQFTVASNHFVTANVSSTNTGIFLAGRVTDATSGEGIANVFVSAARSQVHGVFSDANGNFKIPVNSNVWQLYCDAGSLARNGYFSGDSLFLDVTNRSITNLTLSVKKATALIYGTITDDAGQAIRGIDVSAYAWPFSDYARGQSVTTNGEYRIGVGPGDWQLYLNTDEFLRRGFWPPESYRYDFISLTNETVRRNIVATRVNAHISGTVIDDLGNPVTNMLMYISSNRGTDQRYTDSNGRFNFGVVGGGWNLHASSDAAARRGYLAADKQCEVTNGGELNVTYTLRRTTARILGSIKTPSNVPLTNLFVSASTAVNGNAYEISVITDSKGRFSLNVFPGTWSVNPDSPAEFQVISPKTVSVIKTNSVQFIAQPYPHLRGHLQTSSGELLANHNFDVWLITGRETYSYSKYWFYTGTTDDLGAFDVFGEAGEWEVSIDKDPTLGLFETKTNFIVSADINNVIIEAKQGTNRISGLLQDSEGNPISGVNVEAGFYAESDPGNDDQYISTTGATDTNGYYVLRVFDTNWSVGLSCSQLLARGYGCVNFRTISIAGADVVSDFSVDALTNHLRGDLVDEVGNPITNIFLTISDPLFGFLKWQILTDTNGNFDVPIIDGSWSVAWPDGHAATNGFFGAQAVADVTEGQDYDGLHLMARRMTGFIAGSVHDEHGGFITNLLISARFISTNFIVTGKTDANGNYSLHVANGDWNVTANSNALRELDFLSPATQSVTIENATVHLDFLIQHPLPLQIVATSLPNGIVDWPYSATMLATGGVLPYKWSIASSNSLPPDLWLSSDSGVIQQIPTEAGTFNFTAIVSDAYHNTNFQSIQIIIDPNPCQYVLSTNLLYFSSQRGTNFIDVITSDTCPWYVDHDWNDWWLEFFQHPEKGTATVSIGVPDNLSSVPRIAFASIARQKVTLLQEGTLALDSIAEKRLLIFATNHLGNPEKFTMRQFRNDSYETKYDFLGSDGQVLETGTFSYGKISSHVGRLNLRPDYTFQYYQFNLEFDSHTSGFITNLSDTNFDFDVGTFVLADAGSDFNGDAKLDFLWRHDDGRLFAWSMNDRLPVSVSLLPASMSVGAQWKAVAVADINRDGSPDILWQKDDRSLSIWFMNGTNFVQGVSVQNGKPVGNGWRVVGMADLDNNGSMDFLWQHETGNVAVWLMDHYSFAFPVEARLLRPGIFVNPKWRVVGVSDFNDDGQSDLLWQHEDGWVAVWFMVGTNWLGSTYLNDGNPVSLRWRVVGTADLNQDGQKDIVWKNSDGVMAVWYMNGTTVTSKALLRNGAPVASGWYFVGPK
jgi:hypothetical protein